MFVYVFGHWFILFPRRRSGFIGHCGGVHRQPPGNGTSDYNVLLSNNISITQQGEHIETYTII